LELRNGLLTGALEGEIIDAQAKARYLALYREQYRLAPSAVLAAGDGANDLPMFKAAGFAVAFRPKPALRTATDLCLDYQGLDALLALFQLAEKMPSTH
jgi:phosphoserine phosphatase